MINIMKTLLLAGLLSLTSIRRFAKNGRAVNHIPMDLDADSEACPYHVATSHYKPIRYCYDGRLDRSPV